jgi:hypothetical protein
MAKKKLNPIATALTIAALGVTGWAVWNYVIKPRRDKKRVESMGVDSINNEVLDAQFELVDDQQTA